MERIAIRAHMGIWSYYITYLTFREINEYVSSIDENLHSSKLLRESIQRSLTSNYKSISDYLCNQEERMFNSLVLAVYDGNPTWRGISLEDENIILEAGVLTFSGEEKIFPVDGQHRVEGIKDAILKNSALEDEEVPVIFIGHQNNSKGLSRTRRLFSTLNRYAKPVSLRDIIALDEDDSAAIITRRLIEDYALFQDDRVADSKNKSISPNDLNAFVSIIELYEINSELLNYYIKDFKIKGENGKYLKQGKHKLDRYKRFRKPDDEIERYYQFVLSFWNAMKDNIFEIREYLDLEKEKSIRFRNKHGGSMYFRPVGLLPITQAALYIYPNINDFNFIFEKFNKIEKNVQNEPWKNILWNEASESMNSSINKSLIKMLVLFIYDDQILNEKEMSKLVSSFRKARNDLQNLLIDDSSALQYLKKNRINWVKQEKGK